MLSSRSRLDEDVGRTGLAASMSAWVRPWAARRIPAGVETSGIPRCIPRGLDRQAGSFIPMALIRLPDSSRKGCRTRRAKKPLSCRVWHETCFHQCHAAPLPGVPRKLHQEEVSPDQSNATEGDAGGRTADAGSRVLMRGRHCCILGHPRPC